MIWISVSLVLLNMLTNSGTELMTRAGAHLPRTTTYTRSKPSTVTALRLTHVAFFDRTRTRGAVLQKLSQDWRRVAGNVRLPEVCMTPCTRGVTLGLVVVGEKNCLHPRSRTQGQTGSAVGTAGVKWAMAVPLSRVLLLCQHCSRRARPH